MIGLNLLPDVKKEYLKAQRTRNFVIGISIISMFVVGGITVFLGLFVYIGQNTLIGHVNDLIDDNQSKLESKEEIGKYLTVQNQLNQLAVLHSADYKSIDSRLFDFLIQLNPAAPNNVAISTAKLAQKETTLSLAGSTADFNSLNVFKSTLENATITYTLDGEVHEGIPLFTTVTVKTAALSQGGSTEGVSFEFSLVYSKEAFRPDVTDVKLTVPKLTISDSESNSPQQLFNTTTESGEGN